MTTPPQPSALAHPSRRHWIVKSVGAVAVIAALTCVPAREAPGEIWTGKTVVVAGRYDQQQFAAGETVRITAKVAETIFAAGREVQLEDASADSLIAAGGKIEFRRSSVRELVAGGLDVEIDGTVQDDAVIGVCPVCPLASGRVIIGEDARIGDELTVAGREVEIRGPVGGNLRAAGRTIVLAGKVGGSADLKADQIIIAPGASVAGELTVRSPTQPAIPAGATVTSPVNYVSTPQSFSKFDAARNAFAWAGVAAIGVFMLAPVVLSLLAQIAVPGWLSSSADQLRAKPVESLGLGLLYALLLPTLALVLMLSLIGIPVVLVLLGVSLTLGAAAFVAAPYAVGLFIRERIRGGREKPNFIGRVGWTVLGIILLALVAAIPLLGALIILLTLLASLGAVAKSAVSRIRPMPASPA